MDAGLVTLRLTESARLIAESQVQAAAICAAAESVARAYRSGGKLLLCGNGGSAADAQHIACELTGRFLRERQAWPALALHCNTSILTALANDYGHEWVFSRQVEALGLPGDVLLAISASGRSRNCIEALREAKRRGLTTISLVGGEGGEMKEMADICIHVACSLTPRVQEAHITIGHVICELVEQELTAEG